MIYDTSWGQFSVDGTIISLFLKIYKPVGVQLDGGWTWRECDEIDWIGSAR